MAQRRLGLYGGSFDPPHWGHLLAAQAVAEQLGTQTMTLLPAARPPHKPGQADTPDLAGHRLAMTHLAVEGATGFTVSDIEFTRPGPSYTLRTVEEFARREPDAALYWLIGADTLGELGSWYEIATLVERCTIVTVGRPGWDVTTALERLAGRLSPEQIAHLAGHVLSNVPRVEIASRDIRARVAAGRSIRWHVPGGVADYIARHGLYGGQARGKV